MSWRLLKKLRERLEAALAAAAFAEESEAGTAREILSDAAPRDRRDASSPR
jgi:hypothetical protein